MIQIKFKRKSTKQSKAFLSLRDIRKLGRQPNHLSWDQIINSTLKSILKKSHKSRKYAKRQTKMEKQVNQTEDDSIFERIVTTKIIGGKLYHLIKWQKNDKCSLIENTEVNRRWPQEVIKYYRKHLFFAKEFTQK